MQYLKHVIKLKYYQYQIQMQLQVVHKNSLQFHNIIHKKENFIYNQHKKLLKLIYHYMKLKYHNK